MALDRVLISYWQAVQGSGPLFLGKAFAFTGEPAPRVVSLLGPGDAHLPGLSVAPLSLPVLRLAGVVSDKALYRLGRDTVRLLAFRLDKAGAEGEVIVQGGGSSPTRFPVRLDAFGLAPLPLRDLAAGDYEVAWADASPGEPACTFTVAEYRLAPLVASLVRRQLQRDTSRLAVTLRLETFGVPVEGGVRLELTERGRRLAEARTSATGGLAEVSFELTGAGPHAINVQLEADPSRTASVPLPGSRATERSSTLLSVLGTEVSASLLPGPDTREVRGLHLHEGAVRNTPFRLERVDDGTARIIAALATGPVCVVAADLLDAGRRVTVQRDSLSAGEVIEVEAPGPLAVVAVGAFVGGAPWEGWSAVLRPDPAPPRIVVPAVCVPGAELKISVETGVPEGRQAVYLVVKDARLLGTDTPASLLAGRLKGAVESCSGQLMVTTPGSTRDFGTLLKHADPADLLVFRQVLSPDQLQEVRGLAQQTGARLADLLIKLGYATADQIMQAVAAFHGMSFVELAEVTIPPAVIELVPESVARENVVLPYAQDEFGLKIVMSDPLDFATLEKLQFILNKQISPVLAPRDQIIEAINRHYGQSEIESIDSMLAEFTDTAIDSTETDFEDFEDDEEFDEDDFDDLDDDDFEEDLDEDEAREDDSAASLQETTRYLHFSARVDSGQRPPPRGKRSQDQPADEPEVLFAGVLPAHAGRAELTLPLPDAFTDYVAEAFVCSGLDWSAAEARFRAAKDPFVALDLPAFVHPGDPALGRVHAGASSGKLRLRVTRDGAEVPLRHEGQDLAPGAELSAPRITCSFPAGPGVYEAVVEDCATGATDRSAKEVEAPGKLRQRVRALRFLQPGEVVSREDDSSIIGLKVLPGLERPLAALVEATADYEHCCCEQTASRLRAGCAMYALAAEESRRARAEEVILAGVRRQAQMWLPGRGFKVYPGWPDSPDHYLGRCAAHYLWDLDLLRQALGSSGTPALRAALELGVEMARDTTTAYGLTWPPPSPRSSADAYAIRRFGTDPSARSASLQQAREMGRALSSAGPDARRPGGKVQLRADLSYVAACLLRGGSGADVTLALSLANVVVGQLNAKGRLYSTLDSSAVLALLAELRSAGVIGGGGLVEVEGRTGPAAEFAALPGAATIRAVEGVTAVEVTRVVEEDWASFACTVPVRVALEKEGRAGSHFRVGDALDLRVTLTDGYRTGDLVWVCLPDSLSRILGGGQVKLFAVDLAGRAELTVPLAATSTTGADGDGQGGMQHFAVCVRNMFEEERAGNPGLMRVRVEGGPGGNRPGPAGPGR